MEEEGSSESRRGCKTWIRYFLLGQLLSFVMSLTGVFTTLLVNNEASYAVLQSMTAYAFIFVLYMPLYLYFLKKNKSKTYRDFKFLTKPWKYAILGLFDLEANYLVVLAYEYTNIMSVQLFACLTTPCVLLLSVIILKVSFGLTHIFGSALAIGGLIFLFIIDANGSSQVGGKSRVLGDVFCVGSSILYAVSNVLTEWFIKPEAEAMPVATSEPMMELEDQRVLDETERLREEGEGEAICDRGVLGEPPVGNDGSSPEFAEASDEAPPLVPPYLPMIEYLAIMSFFSLVFSIIQFFAVEWKTFAPERADWTNKDWMYQMLFGVFMLGVYTLMPTLFILCSACFVNLSLLTSNVYAVFWNAVVFHVSPTLWFILTWILITLGIVVFNITDIVDYLWLRRIDRPWKKVESNSGEFTRGSENEFSA